MEILRKKKSGLTLELTPLVDVIFQLLIFFMLASSFAKPAIQMTLPQAKTQDKPVKELVIIAIDQQQALTINGKSTSLNSFQTDLQQSLAKTDQSAVHIRGDKNIPYGTFVQIVDLARQSGATHINLIHEEEE